VDISLVTIAAGIATWISSVDARYTARGRCRVAIWGFGMVLVGIGGILKRDWLTYVAVGIAGAVVCEVQISEVPSLVDRERR
jgi:hypothetical protein